MATTSSIELLRKVGKTEGISFLLLMGIAMPLKYAAGMPLAVSIVGWIHGILFVAFSLVLLNALLRTPLTFKWAVYTFIAALLPFGPFVIDGKLKRFETGSTAV
jgi:integral membrane protein